MADKPKKNMLPDFDEITGIAAKLFKDLKKSVTEISEDYKSKREDSEAEVKPEKPETKTSDEKEDNDK